MLLFCQIMEHFICLNRAKNFCDILGVLLIAPNDGRWFPKVNKVFYCKYVRKFGYDEIRQMVLGNTIVMPRGTVRDILILVVGSKISVTCASMHSAMLLPFTV